MRILFQGDSITDGARLKDEDRRWDLNNQIGHSYVFTIVSTLGRKFPGKYHFINRGVSGDSVDRALARWQKDTLDEKPDVLSILLGINANGKYDGIYPEGVEEHMSHFDKVYRELLDLARKDNPSLKLVIIEPFFLPVGKYKEHYADFMHVFSRKQDLIRKIAEDYGAIFIPTQKKLEEHAKRSKDVLASNGWQSDPEEYWLWDGVHPTEPTHSLLADMWLEATKDIL